MGVGPVEDFVCTNAGFHGECGYKTCPICADGRGGPLEDGTGACPHYIAAWVEGAGIMEGPGDLLALDDAAEGGYEPGPTWLTLK